MTDPYMVFIDFDGTITSNDVGYEMFKKFTMAATEPLVQSYRRGELNSLECLSRESDIWNSLSPNKDEVYDFLDSQELRPGFLEFLKDLEEWHIKPIILSEGFDFYIDRILTNHGLSHLERITNIARYENGHLRPEFPYSKIGCPECSNCKGYHIKRLRPANTCAIYIGDGHSDLHASLVADIVFARSHLEELLGGINRTYFPYNDFDDISKDLKYIIQSDLFTHSERVDIYSVSGRHQEGFHRQPEDSEKAIRFILEDKTRQFLGEAIIPFPDNNNTCQPNLKFLPERWDQGLECECWQVLIDRLLARWPDVDILAMPNILNHNAISLYLMLGFEFEDEDLIRQPTSEMNQGGPIRFKRMVKKNIARH